MVHFRYHQRPDLAPKARRRRARSLAEGRCVGGNRWSDFSSRHAIRELSHAIHHPAGSNECRWLGCIAGAHFLSQPVVRPDGIRAQGDRLFVAENGAGRVSEVKLHGHQATMVVIKDGYVTPTAVQERWAACSGSVSPNLHTSATQSFRARTQASSKRTPCRPQSKLLV
jgi:hypothetical protein